MHHYAQQPDAGSATVVQETEQPKSSPLSFRIGGTEFTPGGFVDFENVFRTTNTGGSTTHRFWRDPVQQYRPGTPD